MAKAPGFLLHSAHESSPPAGGRLLPPPDANGQIPPPPSVPCLSQRPPINLSPALSEDGKTVFTVSRAQGDDHYGYVIAVDAQTLALKWAASLRDRLADGCGVIDMACREGVPLGIDRFTGELPAGRPGE